MHQYQTLKAFGPLTINTLKRVVLEQLIGIKCSLLEDMLRTNDDSAAKNYSEQCKPTEESSNNTGKMDLSKEMNSTLQVQLEKDGGGSVRQRWFCHLSYLSC